jgi:hypothetical protein
MEGDKTLRAVSGEAPFGSVVTSWQFWKGIAIAVEPDD